MALGSVPPSLNSASVKKSPAKWISQNAREALKNCGEKKRQALQADAAKCVKLTHMFAAGAAGPSSAPVVAVVDDVHSEEEEDDDVDESGGRDVAVSRRKWAVCLPGSTICNETEMMIRLCYSATPVESRNPLKSPLDKFEQKTRW